MKAARWLIVVFLVVASGCYAAGDPEWHQGPCGADGTCPNGSPCIDGRCGRSCATTEDCPTGICLGAICLPPAAACDRGHCTDSNPCTKDLCDRRTGSCAASGPVATGTPCSDNSLCTDLDACESGQCVGVEVACGDGIACTGDGCDSVKGCFHVAKADCSDGNDCTLDACDLAIGCTHSVQDGPCTDGNPCTNDACSNGNCVASPGCDDGDPCTTAVCTKGCVQQFNKDACSDGLTCTVSDTCKNGTCAGKADCDDGNVCTADACGGIACSHAALLGIPCGFGATCTDLGACGTPTVDAVTVAKGEAWIGCNTADDATCTTSEGPAHLALVTGFGLDRHEVTLGAFGKCVEAGKCAPLPTDCSPTDAALPVRCVTWYQAAGYCAWKGGRLPTEHEWEKAARGGCAQPLDKAACLAATPKYAWGNAPPDCSLAVFSACPVEGPLLASSAPGDLAPSGARDMAGNLAEWVADWYSVAAYAQSGPLDPAGPSSGVMRVVRGGSFATAGPDLRASRRTAADPAIPTDFIGFRCAYTPLP